MKRPFTLLIVIIAFGFIVAEVVKSARTIGFNEGYEPDQPLPFSHKIHAGENKINCQYCHFGADKGRHAGIPPTQLCLNCHNQIRKDSDEIQKIHTAVKSGKDIEWVKVLHFPDFAYFNHSQHVRLGKIECQTCHGVVEGMTRMRQVGKLSMGWCVGCHRENEIAPPNDHKRKTGGDCAKCHY
ncbi:MAG: cytochrome c3 family protein [Bacteriovoracaceae bacterium]|jgi:hypothetical protein|nr:cytochrome c3 family protein [Bacteriovoracaceae bacterium]